ncbi:MAG: (2Fe-2S) ferredoxin domain-containing protein [Polyangiales bacterium]
MTPAPFRPAVHLFVCTNARGPNDPLRSGCGASGPAVFAALKRAALTSGEAARVWVTSTGCLGHCPPSGCSVAVYPQNEHYVTVTEADAPALFQRAARR